jgi:ABC-type multidrug transport system fused ATPase/permease subunit
LSTESNPWQAQYRLWRAYASGLRPHALPLLGIGAAGMVQSFAYLPLAWMLRRIFDQILPARDGGALLIAAGQLLALQVLTLLLAYWIRVTALRVNQDMLVSIRRRCLERLYDLPRSFYTAADAERLHVTLVYETNYLETMTNALVAKFLPAGLAAIVLLAILLWVDVRFATIIGIAAPTLLVVNRLAERTAWMRQSALRRAFEVFSRRVRFVISAMDLTRAQAAEPFELRRQDAALGDLRRISLDLGRFDAAQQVLQGTLLLTCTLAVLVAGGYAAAEGKVTRGEMIAFYVTAALFATQARAMVDAIPEIRMGARAFGELLGLLTHADREPYRGTRAVAEVGTVELRDVTFAYDPGRPVLEGVSLTIPRGRHVALVGANGSGKSSVISLIAGYYRPLAGSLRAGGMTYDELDIRSLRARLAIVPQNPLLFLGTVRDNVSYGIEKPDERAIEDALVSAGAAQFVSALPQGLDTPIGELGAQLSGGQRQRLVIARALLRRPELLILDEPTNHLDHEAVEHLMETCTQLPFNPSVLVISHEPRVLRHIDAAYQLAGGRLEPVMVSE